LLNFRKENSISKSLLLDKKYFLCQDFPVFLFFLPSVCQPITENPRSDGPDEAGMTNKLSASF
jgi:hypothetical protein